MNKTKNFYIRVGNQKLVIPFSDMTQSDGVWNFSDSFRREWVQKNYPELVSKYDRQKEEFNRLFDEIDEHSRTQNQTS